MNVLLSSRFYAGPFPKTMVGASGEAEFRDVSREEQIERPVERDPQLAIEARQAQQVIAAKGTKR